MYNLVFCSLLKMPLTDCAHFTVAYKIMTLNLNTKCEYITVLYILRRLYNEGRMYPSSSSLIDNRFSFQPSEPSNIYPL